jgi:hypothetical protein
MLSEQKEITIGKNEHGQIVLNDEYWKMIIQSFFQVRDGTTQIINYLKQQELRNEPFLDAHQVRMKYGIGRDLLASLRKKGLCFTKIGRSYLYKDSDIIHFTHQIKKNK